MRPVVSPAGVPVPSALLTGSGSERFPIVWAELWTGGVPSGVRVELVACEMSWVRGRLHQADGSVSWSAGVPVDGRVVPGAPGSLILSGVTELSVWAGLHTVDGAAVCQLGVFGLVDVAWDGVTVTARLVSRSERFSRSRLEQPVEWTAAQDLGAVVAEMLETAWPDVPMVFDVGAGVAPAVVHETQTDPWQACTDAATTAGYWLYVGGDGSVRWVADPLREDAAPAASFEAGVNLMAPQRQFPFEFHNRTYVTSTRTDLVSPVVGVATFTDPGSPYRYRGPVGAVPQWLHSDLVGTTDAANAAASTIQQGTVPADVLSWSAPLMACLELLDPVRVVWADGWVDRVLFPDEIRFDLVGDVMTVTAGAAGQTIEGVF